MSLRFGTTPTTATGTTPSTAGLCLGGHLVIGDQPSRHHVAQPSSMHRVLRRPHPLYRRPAMLRQNGTRLMCGGGWRDWITNPPSEAQ